MATRSFRTRIALLSVFSSSLVLIGSALVACHILWSTERGRMDNFLGSHIRLFISVENQNRGPRGPFAEFDGEGPGGPEGPGRPEGPHDAYNPYAPDGMDEPSGSADFTGPVADSGFEDQPPWGPPGPDRWREDDEEAGGDDPDRPESFHYYKIEKTEREQFSENWPDALTLEDFKPIGDGELRFRTVSADGRFWRVCYAGGGGRTAISGLDLTSNLTNIRRMATAMLLSIPVSLMLIALGALVMVRRSLKPVHDLTHIVESVTASGLDQRIESEIDIAEFANLVSVFNKMMARLERSFMQATRFSSDAAHELRTPISVLQGYIEQMQKSFPSESETSRDLGGMSDEVHRIKSILEKLLLLARLDAGQVQLHLEGLDLSVLMESVVEDIQALAPGIEVTAEIEPDVTVQGDEALLETAIQNLGSNAIKYNLETGGRIYIELKIVDGQARLSVSNTGPKIAGDEREAVFDRFYRSDPARSRETGGMGLGLGLARDIVLAHHGTLALTDAPGGVNRFEILLPADRA